MVRKDNETQIKSEKRMENLTNSVKFMSWKFDEYEKERLEKEARIVELKVKLFLYLLKLKSWNIQLTKWSNIQDVTRY